MKNVALITGASSGIGKELARIHASKGGDLVIVARSEDKLNQLAEELNEKHGTNVHVIAQDLSQLSAAEEIYNNVKSAEIEVEYLMNNAGFGGQGYFHERAWEKDLAMINVNMTSLTALTRFFLPDMVTRNKGRILNTSSTAGFIPGPLQAVYYATKAYVNSFSNAIAQELSGTNITVTALQPGATETEFAKTSGMDKTDLFAKTFSAHEVALAGYNAMMAGKMDVVAGISFSQKMMFPMMRMMPKKMLLKQIHKMQEVKN